MSITEETAAKLAAEALGAATPYLFEWMRSKVRGGSVDPAAELRAMLDSADAVAEAAEDLKFGRDP